MRIVLFSLYTRLKKNDMIKMIIKIINSIFAIPALSFAMPPNPKTAAIIARIKKIKAQFNNMTSPLKHSVTHSRSLTKNKMILQ